MKKVELIYGASPENIYIWKFKYPADEELTVEKVVDDSKVLLIYKLNKEEMSYAIFAEKVELDARVQDGDRVSVLRSLLRRRNEPNRDKAVPHNPNRKTTRSK
ncbi:RnfH family protein [Psittacicella gerlachiana]|uniref:Uncharacterized protein n=1 Tax=Psittacicella gerlachiana TaxID=2028574 RepID=A0A3A1Y227_9GAMM|nr:RnfH family protein [Psittacicella gerlachiana]RIY31470.1 hypothetical protein CKF59_07630 [Psittacicella gerlachiana]